MDPINIFSETSCGKGVKPMLKARLFSYRFRIAKSANLGILTLDMDSQLKFRLTTSETFKTAGTETQGLVNHSECKFKSFKILDSETWF